MLRSNSQWKSAERIKGRLMVEADRPVAVVQALEDGAGDEPGDVANPDDDHEGLLAFRRLDLLLAVGVEAARHRFGPEAASDSYRGLYLTEEQVQRAARHRVAEPLVAARQTPRLLPAWDRIASNNLRWVWLRDRYDLTELELDVVLIALGPDVDRRYEKLYGYLQDDVSARRPTVNLALDLLTTTPSERLTAMQIFAADARLTGHQIVNLRAERGDEPPLIARTIAVDPQVTAALLGQRGVDHRLRDTCRLDVKHSRIWQSECAEPDPRLDGLVSLLVRQRRGRPVRLCFHGPPGTGRRRTALALGGRLARPVLLVSGSVLARDVAMVPNLLRLALRHAELEDALVYIEDVDALVERSGDACLDVLVSALAAHPGVVVLGTAQPWLPSPHESLGVCNVAFSAPTAGQRRRIWRREVGATGATAASGDVAAVADRFRLSTRQIRDAALIAAGEAGLRQPRRSSSAPRLSRRDLFSSARSQTGHQLTSFARRIRPVHGWEDLVVPEDAHRQLRELAARVEHRTLVMDEWGFQERLAGGRGVTALFVGPPGTGKTMGASVIAAELGLDLFAIDLSTVVSKYIGDTEKNLSRVFSAAADSDAILFFDEADALFGKRSEVRDAHDRYANVEIAYLLQRMEEYEGLAILATNVRHHIDEAFIRRLDLIVDFPFPDTAERLRIWRTCLPTALTLDDGVDFPALAEHRLAGANIRNAVLGAAYLAAAAGRPIGQADFVAATRRELAKMGKLLTNTGLDPPADG
jgi:SpoVK/Ycf46/Vps4 family AAA+-type ATPase